MLSRSRRSPAYAQGRAVRLDPAKTVNYRFAQCHSDDTALSREKVCLRAQACNDRPRGVNFMESREKRRKLTQLNVA